MFPKHHHTWKSLRGGIIEVSRSMIGTKAKSVYQVIEFCDGVGCNAGRTRDGVIVADITVQSVEREGIVITTSPLKWRK